MWSHQGGWTGSGWGRRVRSAVLGLVIEGDSIAAGYNTTNGPLSSLYAAATGQTGINRATAGDTLVNMDSTYATDVAPYYNAATANTLLLEGGTNDFHAGTSLATVQAATQSIASKARTTGFLFAASTITKNTSWTTGANETARQNYNAWLRANWMFFADFLVDLEAIPQLSDPTNTTDFSDGLHLTNVSNGYVVDCICSALGVSEVPDTTPDAFTFTDVTGATLSTVYTSNTVTVSGINSPASISVTGGSISINGGAFTSSSGTVSNGDQVQAQGTSSASNSTSVNVAVTIGGVTDTYTISTVAAASPLKWNPADIGPNAVTAASDRDLTTNSTNGFNAGRANQSKTTGKWYVEMVLTSGAAGGNSWVGFGAGKSDFALNNYLGSSPTSWMHWLNSGGNFFNGASLAAGPGATSSDYNGLDRPGDIFMLAFDFDAGKAWFGRNGSWAGSGNPAAGTNAYVTWTAGGAWFPAATVAHDGGVVDVTLPATATYTIPSGFTGWNG